ncbi:MAG: hypothetical protein FJ291_11650 [Planctomycetes bacterium]|nr:hypothetical protein [Planctomycetota bacterium]
MKVRFELWVALGVVVLLAAIAYVSRRTPNPGLPLYKQAKGDPFWTVCSDFLNHRITAEAFCKEAQPPTLVEAMKRPGKKVPAPLPLAGIVTLQGQTDHSGTEVAVVMSYDYRMLESVIASPFCVRTDPQGCFDFSTLKLEAWQSAPVSAGGKGSGSNTRDAVASPPTAQLHIRRKGFESRVVSVNIWGLLHGALPPKGASTWHVGAIELLPEGTARGCYTAFGAQQYPTCYPFPFDIRRCEPWHVREHLEEHPGCLLADDALYCFLAANYGAARPGVTKAVVADGYKLFRERFMAGKDNTGQSLFYQPGVSLDGSWGKLIDELQGQSTGR